MTITETVEEGMFQSENPINELNRMLVRYDLTPNQAKVYLFLSKIGIKTASEIAKSLKIPRTETYHLLSTLQQKGIIFSVFGKPTKFNAVGIEESLEILINNEKNRISELESGVSSFIIFYMGIVNYLTSVEKTTGMVLLIFSVFVATGTLLGTVYISRSITKPIEKLAQNMTEFSKFIPLFTSKYYLRDRGK